MTEAAAEVGPALFFSLVIITLSFAPVFSLQGQGGPIWRAKWHALRGLPRVLRQRRAVQSARTAEPAVLESRMAHGLKPLLSRGGGPS